MKNAMGYKWHSFISVSVFLLLIFVNAIVDYFEFTSFEFIALFLISFLYGLMPDIDTMKSKIGKIYLTISLIVILFGILLSFYKMSIIVAVILLFFVLVKHRGITHTVLGALIFSIPLIFIGIEYFVFGLISYLSHLFADGKIKLT